MRDYEPPTTSFWCLDDDHDECGHEFGARIEFAPRRFGGGTFDRLCQCSCHAGCPLWGLTEVRPEVWTEQCTCPGSEAKRARRARIDAEAEQRRARARAAMAEVDFGHGRSKQELQHEMEEALRRHGADMPAGMIDTIAEAAAAATGPRALALPRLGLLGGRLAVKGFRFLRDHRVDPSDGESEAN